MAVDPIAEAILADLGPAGKPRIETQPPQAVRRAARETKLMFAGEPEPIADMHDLVIDRPGGPIPARIYRSLARDVQTSALPLLVYFHGGGWMMGDLDTHDQLCRRLANLTGGVIFAIDYRLAPEHKFPAAVDDALASVEWAVRNHQALGVDGARISVGGDSAGANLAAVTSLANRGSKDVRIRSQVLFYPVFDLSLRYAETCQIDGNFSLTYSTLVWFRGLYLRDAGDQRDWRASPLLAERLDDLPPALIVTAQYDPLHLEAFEYVRRLQDSHVRTTHIHMNDQCHGFLNSGTYNAKKREIMRMIAAAIRYQWAS
ncbi:MAG: alpha/beta hydrolase [Bacteroidota bacterium]